MKRFLVFTFILITAAGCAPQHSNNSGLDLSAEGLQVSQQSLQSFQTTLYAFGQTQGCVGCHANKVNPSWMNSNLTTAYNFARPYLDLNDPTNSLYSVYVANGHCGTAVCMDANNITIIQDALQVWANAELDEADGDLPTTPGLTLSNPPYRTMTMAIPANLPLLTAANPAILRFDLSLLTPQVPALVGAILEISLRSYNSANTTYKIYNPRLAGNSAPVLISGLHVYVRPASGSGLGTEDVVQGLGWSELSINEMITPLPSPMPTGPMSSINPLTNVSLGITVQSPADVITIGFAQIQ